MFETLTLEVQPNGVARLTLDRPEVHNALSRQLIDELAAAAEQISGDPAVRVVILSGTGKSFCAGGDLKWMQDQMAADSAARAEGARALAHMLGRFNALPKPVIAQVHGRALGGGVGLCCVADLVVAEEEAEFGLTETRLGLIPATIGPFVVARMGEGHARQVFMSSQRFRAPRAKELGIVSIVCASVDLADRANVEAEAYLSCSPSAVAEAKALALQLGSTPSEADVEASIEALVRRWESKDAQDGIAAFFDRREPPWA